MDQKARFREALKESMKNKDRLRTETIRSLLSAFQYLEMEKGIDDLSTEDCLTVLQREAKKRREEIEFAEKAGRVETVEGLKRELTIVEEFLPKQMSREELTVAISDLVKANHPRNLGDLMKLLKDQFSGSYDGKLASEVARQILSK